MKVRKKMMWLERMIQTFRDEVDLPKTCCTHSCVKGIAKGERLHCLHFVGTHVRSMCVDVTFRV